MSSKTIIQTIPESRANILPAKYLYFAPAETSVVCSKVVVHLLLLVYCYSRCLWGFVIGPYFMQYLVSLICFAIV